VRSANASLATVCEGGRPVRKEQRGARTAQSFASYTQRATWRPYCPELCELYATSDVATRTAQSFGEVLIGVAELAEDLGGMLA